MFKELLVKTRSKLSSGRTTKASSLVETFYLRTSRLRVGIEVHREFERSGSGYELAVTDRTRDDITWRTYLQNSNYQDRTPPAIFGMGPKRLVNALESRGMALSVSCNAAT